MKGYIHSIESFSAVDGMGVRSVIFLQGCPYKCPYCHNVDARAFNGGRHLEAEEIYKKVKRYYPYIEKGGVTFSGGEPLFQAEFLKELITLFKNDGIHVAIETAGFPLTENVKKVLELTDHIILDIKSIEEKENEETFGVYFFNTQKILEFCNDLNKEVWIRQVIVENWNDTETRITKLKDFLSGFSCVKKIELLPFKKLCIHKWEALNIPFPFEKYDETSTKTIERLNQILQK